MLPVNKKKPQFKIEPAWLIDSKLSSPTIFNCRWKPAGARRTQKNSRAIADPAAF
jgi:hypothetical protein